MATNHMKKCSTSLVISKTTKKISACPIIAFKIKNIHDIKVLVRLWSNWIVNIVHGNVNLYNQFAKEFEQREGENRKDPETCREYR